MERFTQSAAQALAKGMIGVFDPQERRKALRDE